MRDTGPEFGGYLANHGPMAADAMIRLGGADLVGRWVERYRTGLEPAVPLGDRVTADDWREHLGRIDRLGDWIGFFRSEAHGLGWQQLLDRWWPRLLPGAAASATHGLIRTAHAVRNLTGPDRPHPHPHPHPHPLMVEELTTGLAYWAARYQTLPGEPRLDGPHPLREAVELLPRLDRRVPSGGDGIGDRLRVLFGLAGLSAPLDTWGGTPDTDAGLGMR